MRILFYPKNRTSVHAYSQKTAHKKHLTKIKKSCIILLSNKTNWRKKMTNLIIIWTTNDGDEKIEEILFDTIEEADAHWDEIGNTFDDTGRWCATDFEIE